MKRLLIAALLVLGLAACDSAEERAEKHFQTATELREQGDNSRALVELRNVLQLDDRHRGALLMFAEITQESGNAQGAFNRYRRLVETYPDDLKGNRELAEIAFLANEFDMAERYAEAAEELEAGDPGIAAIRTALDYREAALDKDSTAMADAAAEAQTLLEADADDIISRRVVIANLLRDQRFGEALEMIDAGLERDETDRELYAVRFGVLSQLDDKDAMEAQFKRMVELFPEDESVGAALVRWYVSEKRIDEAEAWLRNRIDPEASDPEPRLTLVRFLSELRDAPTALAELDEILAMDPRPADVAAAPDTFRSLHAGFLFRTGQSDAAIAELQALIDEAGQGTPEGEALERLNRYKVSLAQMQTAAGNLVGARKLVEEVLAADPAEVGALKLKSRWQVMDDETGEAIVNLRAALSEAPRDSEIMTLLASAYEREGNRELMAEMLSLAVEASNRAPRESLQYANFLAQQERYRAAEEVVINALRLAPRDVGLLNMLGRVHLAMEDWARARQDIDRLRQLGGNQAVATADELQAQLLARQSKTEDLTTFLEELGEGDIRSTVAVIRANLISGRTDVALNRSAALMEENPDDPVARYVRGLVLTIAGQYEEGITLLEETVAETPEAEQAWTALYRAYQRTGAPEKATETLTRAAEALPESMNLQWILAGELERNGDIDGAIAIYEDLYQRNSSAVIVANNLASLLSSYRDDPETLERAWTVARRLRGLEVPAFQDTYGWIALRRGDAQEALEPLEAAARGLPGDPTVQYHLAEAYAALDRVEEARTAYETARTTLETADVQPPGLASRISAGLEALPEPADSQ